MVSDERRLPTVVAVGNPLLGDDGLGLRALELLGPLLPRSVRSVDAGLIGLELLEVVERASHLLVLDTIDAGAAPGTLLRFEGPNPPVYDRPALSPHQLQIADVLSLARMRGSEPGEVVVLGVQPATVSPGIGLSPEVRGAVPRLVEEARAQIERWVAAVRSP